MRNKIVATIIVVGLLMMNLAIVGSGEQPIDTINQKPIVKTNAVHTPIRINSDAGFTAPNGVNAGVGSLANPYIIDDWEINGTGYGDCIYIGNTTKHFIIRNCTLFETTQISPFTYFQGAGVQLLNVSHGELFNNIINNTDIGTFHQTNSYINITTNNITQYTNRAIYFASGGSGIIDNHNITIEHNDINQTNVLGISLQYTNDTRIFNNTWVGGLFILTRNNNRVYIENNSITFAVSGSPTSIGAIYESIPSGWQGSNDVYFGNHTLNAITTTIYIPLLLIQGGSRWTFYNITINGGSSGNDGIELDVLDSKIIDCIIDNTNYGIVIESTSNNTIIENVVVNNTGYGIRLDGGDYNYIGNSTITNNSRGITASQSNDNTIFGCNISHNVFHGISLFSTSHRNIIRQNVLMDQFWGMEIKGTYHNVTHNYIGDTTTSSGQGLRIDGANYCTIYRNNITKYTGTNALGINLISGSNNKIYYNNFISNTIHASDTGSANYWDNGYNTTVKGGNYWDNYTGVDTKKGWDQQSAGSDGIGDTPLIIDSNSQDGYPLMQYHENVTYTPIADAGIDDTILNGTVYMFDGSNSYDINSGWLVNYTWNVTYNGSNNFFYGLTPSFSFWNTSGNPYKITLNVTDNDGLYDLDYVLIIVLTVHSSIRINSDAQFTAPNGVNAGAGSLADPYIIDNWDINGTGSGDCIYVGNTTKHFVIRNCTLYNATVYSTPYFLRQGINLYNSTNATIHNNRIYKWSIPSGVSGGIRADQTNNISITENYIYKEKYGMYFDTGDNITIDDNDIIMQDANELCNVYGGDISNMTINNNRLYTYDNDDRGIQLLTYEYVIVTNNIIDLSSYSVSSYYDSGCYLQAVFSSQDALLKNNTISNATICVEIIGACPNLVILNSTFNARSNAWDIYNNGADGMIVDNCSFAVRIEIFAGTDYCNINNTHRYAPSNTQALYIKGDYNNITNCSIDSPSYYLAISVWVTGNNNTFNNLTCKKTLDDAVRLWGNDNVIENSFLTDMGSDWHDAGVDIDGFNNIIRNTTISHAPTGILCENDGSNTIIEDCTIEHINLGIVFDNPIVRNNVTIENNTIDYLFDGIDLYYNKYTNITNNTLFGNGSNAEFGIYMPSNNQYNQIYNNNISNNIWFSNGYGVMIFGASNHNNSVYHNNFHNNNYHHRVVNGANNIFDMGHQWGGNYYSDVTTTDLYHGINQDISGADNLNDTSFIGWGTVDNYPLVNEYQINNTPVAEAGVDKFGDRLHEFNGTNSSDAGGSILNYTWNFTYSATPYTFYGLNFSFNFSSQGIYIVTLNTTDSVGNYDLDTTTVYALPVTAVTESDTSVYRSVSYQFNGSNSYYYIQNWTWNFTHNSTSTYLYGATPSFSFWELGIFNVTLNVTDDFGRTDEDWVNITVLNNPPVADAGIDQAGLKGYYTLNGSASSDPDGVITNYTWNFTYNASPQTLYLTYPLFNFQILGNYLITLNVSDNDSGTDEDTMWVNITNANPVANAGTDIVGKRLITFDGSLSSDVDGSIVNYTWNFTDSGTPVTIWGVSPSYDFNISQAPIIVTLNVTDDEGGTDEDTVQVTIVILLPIADAGADQGTNKGTFILDGSGSSDPDGTIINWTWTFTYDGSPRTVWGEQPTWDFLLEVNTSITLNVTDDDWRYDEDTTWVNITFKYPVARFSISPSGTNKGSRLIDGLLSTDEDGTIDNYTYEWEYNSITYYRYISTFSFDFLLEGLYNITLNITDDNGLQDETYRVFSIVFIDPVAVIENRTTAIMFNDISFDGSASYDEDGYIANYTWNFTYNEVNYTFYGDNFTFRFSEVEGNVTLTLNVTDDDGRYNTTTIIFEVQNPMRLLTDLLLLLIPLFIILLIVMLIILYVKKATKNTGDG